MGNTYARLWAVVPDEKRYFSDPPFIKEFYTLVADFVQGFAVDFPEEASLKFLNPIQWNTLVYEDDLLSYKYRSLVDSEQETGYHKNAEIDGQILSDETFEDGVPHLKLTIDDQDRRLFSVWTIRQLANIIAVTEKTWDMEIASVLFFQPDPINHIFGNKYDTGSTQNEQKLDAVSSKLMAEKSRDPFRDFQMNFDLCRLLRIMLTCLAQWPCPITWPNIEHSLILVIFENRNAIYIRASKEILMKQRILSND